MTVEKIFYRGSLHDDNDEIEEDNPALLSMVLANDTKIENGGDLLGDPTEMALIQYAFDQNINVHDLLEEHKRVQEVPFDSERKLMSTVNKYGDKFFVAVKGAPDELLKRVTSVKINDEITPITAQQRQDILQTNQDMAKKLCVSWA